MKGGNNLNEEQKLYCKDIKSISSFTDKIVFRKHTHKINHVDLMKNLIMTSGDDDLIIIIDLVAMKYIFQYYDIINGTSFCRFLDPLSFTSTSRIIYYGKKSYKLYIYDYAKNEVLLVVNLLRENLNHLEYNIKSNLLITTQDSNCVVWKLNENNLKANYNLKDSYYAIINEEKRHIISASTKHVNEFEKSYISIYRYDNNRDLTLIKDHDVNIDFDFIIDVMNFYKNYEHYFLIIMSSKNISIVKLDEDDNKFDYNLKINKELRFTYIEPVFTRELLIGYNNGDVCLINPFLEQEVINKQLNDRHNKYFNINRLRKEVAGNEPNHDESVVQIKMSDYYPFYVSIADEMIIYQLKE